MERDLELETNRKWIGGKEQTRGGGDWWVEERDGSIDEERIRREAKADDPVGRLKKATASEDTEELLPLVEYYFEQNRNEPQHQGSQEEDLRLVLISYSSIHYSLILYSLAVSNLLPSTGFLNLSVSCGDRTNFHFVTDRERERESEWGRGDSFTRKPYLMGFLCTGPSIATPEWWFDPKMDFRVNTRSQNEPIDLSSPFWVCLDPSNNLVSPWVLQNLK